MAKHRFVIPNIWTSNFDEIAILEKLHKAFKGSGSYLETLFSVDMLRWAAGMMRSNFSPDLMSYYDDANGVIDTLNETLAEVRLELQEAKARVNELQDGYGPLANEIKEK